MPHLCWIQCLFQMHYLSVEVIVVFWSFCFVNLTGIRPHSVVGLNAGY